MKTVVTTILCLVLCLHFVAANVYITEIMHSPSQTASDSDGEWLELYNDGTVAVDLSNWTIDGKDFDDVTIEAKEYVVVARELLDGDDADEESFEWYWGNNNGLWDEDFVAVDGSLSLSAEDTVVLEGEGYTESITYNSSFGGDNGRSIERVSLNEWKEGDVDGSPGYGEFSSSEERNGSVAIYLEVSNSAPEIVWINVTTDDSSAEGAQVMPNVDDMKNVSVDVLVNESNGAEDIELVSLSLENESYSCGLVSSNESLALHTCDVVMESFDLAGDYVLDIEVSDGSSSAFSNTSFEYLGILSTTLNTSSLSFNLEPGESSVAYVEVLNTGNVLLDVEVSASDLFSVKDSLSVDYLSVYREEWISLASPATLGLSLEPLASHEVALQLEVPFNTDVGSYEGSVIITSMEVV